MGSTPCRLDMKCNGGSTPHTGSLMEVVMERPIDKKKSVKRASPESTHNYVDIQTSKETFSKY